MYNAKVGRIIMKELKPIRLSIVAATVTAVVYLIPVTCHPSGNYELHAKKGYREILCPILCIVSIRDHEISTNTC